jgi:hypothetical protein
VFAANSMYSELFWWAVVVTIAAALMSAVMNLPAL